MSRELDINIVVNDGGAKDQLAAVDAAADRTGASVAALAAPISDFEARMQKAAVASGLTAQQLAAVRAQLQAGIDPKAIDSTTVALQKAEQASTSVGRSLNNTGIALKDTDTAAKDAAAESGGFGQMQAMATRIVERMAILYALRGGFQFIEGIIQGAQETTKLAAQLDLSVESVQELQYAARESDVPFTVFATAVDNLQRKLGEGSSGLSKALTDVGLSFEDLRRMTPDEALTATATALASVTDHFQRAGAEAQIFGSDKIDPVIGKLADLRKEAHDSSEVLSKEQLQALSDIGRGWDDATARMKAYFAELLTHGIPGPKPNSPYLPPYQTPKGFNLSNEVGGGPTRASGPLADAPGAGGFNVGGQGLSVPSIDPGSLTDAKYGPDAAQQLAKLRAELVPLTDAQGVYLDNLRAIGQLTLQNADAYHINNVQLEEYKKDLELAKTMAAAQAKAEAEAVDMDFKTQMQLLKMIGDYNKEQEKRLQLTNAFVAANVEASGKLAARSGVDVNGRSLTTDPFDAANQKYARQIETIRRNAPEGFDTKPQEDEAAAELQDAFDALRKSAMGLGDAQDKAGAAATAAGRATAASAPSVMTLGSSALDAAASFATAGATVNPAGGARRKTPDEIAALGPLGNGLLQYAQSGIATSISTVGIDPRALRGYRSGTNGYEDFGSGTPVMLHGWEKVTPQSGEGGSGAVSIGDIHIHGNVQSQAMASRMVDDIASEVYRRISMRGGKQQLTR